MRQHQRAGVGERVMGAARFGQSEMCGKFRTHKLTFSDRADRRIIEVFLGAFFHDDHIVASMGEDRQRSNKFCKPIEALGDRHTCPRNISIGDPGQVDQVIRKQRVQGRLDQRHEGGSLFQPTIPANPHRADLHNLAEFPRAAPVARMGAFPGCVFEIGDNEVTRREIHH